ncbi:MAG TPA: hypothetical protein VLA14_16235 [Polyangia bacterium]|nr:hypothetical protein [Polyangia bacterium]
MQTPGSAGHSASVWQARQVFAVVLQMGVVGVLQSEFATHWTHVPDGAQAGVAPPRVTHSLEPTVQPRHACVSQIGFVASAQ